MQVESKVLVGLDDLYDTRLGVVMNDPSWTSNVSEILQGWRKRKTFMPFDTEKVSVERWEQRYRARTKEDLKISLRTPVSMAVSGLAFKVEQEGRVGTLTVEINYFPYDLTQTEKDLFTEMFSQAMNVNVRMVSIDPMGITAGMMTAWECVFMHDFLKWYGRHSETLDLGKLTEVQFYAPRLVNAGILEDEKFIKAMDKLGKNTDVFETLENILLPVVSVIFLDTYMWCGLKQADFSQPEYLKWFTGEWVKPQK